MTEASVFAPTRVPSVPSQRCKSRRSTSVRGPHILARLQDEHVSTQTETNAAHTAAAAPIYPLTGPPTFGGADEHGSVKAV